MKEQFENVFAIIASQDIEGTITGSYLLGYKEEWKQDLDVFCHSEQSFTALLYFMEYNPMFQILDKLEAKKKSDYLKAGKSSLDKLNLITIKYYFNTCVPVNIIYKKYQKSTFEVISNFDLDIIAVGFDIKTKKILSLRESIGMDCDWNKWNMAYYDSNIWSTKRFLRQFSRVVKYTQRGYNVSKVTTKYISMVEDIINTENIYRTEKGIVFYEKTVEEFEILLKILKSWESTLFITPEALKELENIY